MTDEKSMMAMSDADFLRGLKVKGQDHVSVIRAINERIERIITTGLEPSPVSIGACRGGPSTCFTATGGAIKEVCALCNAIVPYGSGWEATYCGASSVEGN